MSVPQEQPTTLSLVERERLAQWRVYLVGWGFVGPLFGVLTILLTCWILAIPSWKPWVGWSALIAAILMALAFAYLVREGLQARRLRQQMEKEAQA